MSLSDFSSNNSHKIPVCEDRAKFSVSNIGQYKLHLNYFKHSPARMPIECDRLHQIQVFLNDRKVEPSLLNKIDDEATLAEVTVIPASSYHLPPQEKTELILIAIEPEMVVKFARRMGLGESLMVLPHFKCNDLLLHSIVIALLNKCQSYEKHSIYIELLSQTIIAHLLHKYSSPTDATNNYEYRMEQAVEYIDFNLDNSLKLETLAQHLKLSKYYFCRSFTKHFGIPPYKYILQKRIDRAKLLIQQQPEWKMVDIALECGFSSQSHFNKHFRRAVGTTPSAYRRSLQRTRR